MPDLIVNDAPPELLRRIERLARQQQRSVSAELIALIEAALEAESDKVLPASVKLRAPLTPSDVDRGGKDGRA
jgi:predicted negative regulator of RcsB-dependent stress response